MHQTGVRNIKDMGGLASKMPITAIASAIAAFSIGGIPPFACFISEFHIFVGAVTAAGTYNFFYITTILMLIATVFSLAYVLRYFWKVFLESPTKPTEEVETIITGDEDKEKSKSNDPPIFMIVSMLALAAFCCAVGYLSWHLHRPNSRCYINPNIMRRTNNEHGRYSLTYNIVYDFLCTYCTPSAFGQKSGFSTRNFMLCWVRSPFLRYQ
jgi:formate hydrogenlyase subunit 3/multisubunit Na+/H+ antiporter MnhD subunit